MRAQHLSENGAISKSRAFTHIWDEVETLKPGSVLSVPCPHCFGTLELSQPDSSRSDALLGMCTTCPAWFLVSGRDGIIRDLGLSELLGPPRPPKKRI